MMAGGMMTWGSHVLLLDLQLSGCDVQTFGGGAALFRQASVRSDMSEAAMLAGLIQAPSELDPVHHLRAAQARAANVLDGMVADHVIDAKAANAAKASPATVKASPELAPAQSWFADWIAKGAAGLAGSQTGSVSVRTTLMLDLQNLAQQVVDDALDKQGRRLGVSEGALVAPRSPREL